MLQTTTKRCTARHFFAVRVCTLPLLRLYYAACNPAQRGGAQAHGVNIVAAYYPSPAVACRYRLAAISAWHSREIFQQRIAHILWRAARTHTRIMPPLNAA